MIQSIHEKDIDFCECLHNPLCVAESLFTNYDNLSFFEPGKLGHIRLGQIPLLSYEYIIAKDPSLLEKDNFKLLTNVGNAYILGGRNFGKTLTSKIDMLISLMLHDGWPMGLSSYDHVHIRGVMEPVIDCLEHHEILKHYKKSVKRNPTYLITSVNNAVIEGINMNINNKNPGNQFFQKHFKKIWIEEASFETEEVNRNRQDSKHEIGCIERLSGMTLFTKYSPAGIVFYDQTLKPSVLNLPQYINPFWDDKEKARAIKKFGGESSIGFRTFVKGEVVEEGLSVFDMLRVRSFYVEDRTLKLQEVTKQKFPYFKNVIIVERPNNAENIYVCADIGESAPTEIIILSQLGQHFKLLYNITLYSLTDKEQSIIFQYVIDKVKANFIGIDTTDGMGRAIYRRLEEFYPKENLIWCMFTEKVAVDFAKDDRNNLIYENGKPTFVEEYVSEWSVKHLRDLLYAGQIEIPEDSYKLDVQLNSVKAFQTGTRTVYECVSEENHIFQAFQVFSMAQWLNEFRLIRPVINKEFAKGFIG
jgi:hypothetical protein